MTDDGRLLTLLAALGLAGAAVVRTQGSRGVVRAGRSEPNDPWKTVEVGDRVKWIQGRNALQGMVTSLTSDRTLSMRRDDGTSLHGVPLQDVKILMKPVRWERLKAGSRGVVRAGRATVGSPIAVAITFDCRDLSALHRLETKVGAILQVIGADRIPGVLKTSRLLKARDPNEDPRLRIRFHVADRSRIDPIRDRLWEALQDDLYEAGVLTWRTEAVEDLARPKGGRGKGSKGAIRAGRSPAPAKVYWKTEKIPWTVPGTRWKTAVIQYGFNPRDWRLNPRPSFSFLIGTGPRAAEGGCAGDPDLLQKKLPGRLRRMQRWHLTDADGTPMHYVANGVFWAELATGRRPRQPHDPGDPLAIFKRTVVWDAVPSTDQGQPWTLPIPELTRWLERRLPRLREVFDADLEEAGISKPPPPPLGSPSRGSRDWSHIPGPYARPGALASFTPGSFGVVRRGRPAAEPGPLYAVLGKTGDENPLDGPGGVVFIDFDGRTLWWTWLDHDVLGLQEEPGIAYRVYQVDLSEGDLLTGALAWANTPGKLQSLAHSANHTVAELVALARDPDPMGRARFAEILGSVYGLESLDDAPQDYERQELVDRFFRGSGSFGVVRAGRPSPPPPPNAKSAARLLTIFREQGKDQPYSHPGPSVKTLIRVLGPTFQREGFDPKDAATALKTAMDTLSVRIVLNFADTLLGGHGVEVIDGIPNGLRYVNRGDTYDPTLIYDRQTQRYVAGDWGTIVERNQRRFP